MQLNNEYNISFFHLTFPLLFILFLFLKLAMLIYLMNERKEKS